MSSEKEIIKEEKDNCIKKFKKEAIELCVYDCKKKKKKNSTKGEVFFRIEKKLAEKEIKSYSVA